MGRPAIVNLTGRPLHVYQSGRKVATLPADLPGFRLEEPEVGDQVIAGLEVVSVTWRMTGLPDPQPGRWLVVTQVAAFALHAAGVLRGDVLFPGPGVSDRGRVVGCRGLRWLVPPCPSGDQDVPGGLVVQPAVPAGGADGTQPPRVACICLRVEDTIDVPPGGGYCPVHHWNGGEAGACCPEYARTGQAHTEVCPAFDRNDPIRVQYQPGHTARKEDPHAAG